MSECASCASCDDCGNGLAVKPFSVRCKYCCEQQTNQKAKQIEALREQVCIALNYLPDYLIEAAKASLEDSK